MKNLRSLAITLLFPPLAATASGVTDPAPTDKAEAATPGCRLIVSKNTKALYPEGFLELAAKDCWAGPGADIAVIGKDDLVNYATRHSGSTGRTVVDALTNNFYALLPSNMQAKFRSIAQADRDALLRGIMSATMSDTNSGAFKYRFESAGKPAKEIFITVTDDIYHVHDNMAAVAGIYLGSYISDVFLSERFSDRPSLRAKAFAHETGHGKNNDSLVTIRDGKIVSGALLGAKPIDRLARETGADLHGHEKYQSAVDKGIAVIPVVPRLDHALRALSAYFSYGVKTDHKDIEATSYEAAYVKAYLANPNPLPWHATSAALEKKGTPDIPAQAEGVLQFRQAMNRALGQLVFSAEHNLPYQLHADFKGNAAADIDSCARYVEFLPESYRKKDAQAPEDATTFFGNCVGHSTFGRSLAINAVIALENEGYAPASEAARVYFREFSEVIQIPALSEQFMHAAATYYVLHQRDDLTEGVRKKWDDFFTRTRMIEDAPAVAPK